MQDQMPKGLLGWRGCNNGKSTSTILHGFVINENPGLIITESANNWEHKYTLSKISWFMSKQLNATSDDRFGVRKDINIGTHSQDYPNQTMSLLPLCAVLHSGVILGAVDSYLARQIYQT